MISNATPVIFDDCPLSPSSPQGPQGLAESLLQWIWSHGWLGVLFFGSLVFFRFVDGLEHFVDGFPQDNNLGAYLLAKELEIDNVLENR